MEAGIKTYRGISDQKRIEKLAGIHIDNKMQPGIKEFEEILGIYLRNIDNYSGEKRGEWNKKLNELTEYVLKGELEGESGKKTKNKIRELLKEVQNNAPVGLEEEELSRLSYIYKFLMEVAWKAKNIRTLIRHNDKRAGRIDIGAGRAGDIIKHLALEDPGLINDIIEYEGMMYFLQTKDDERNREYWRESINGLREILTIIPVELVEGNREKIAHNIFQLSAITLRFPTEINEEEKKTLGTIKETIELIRQQIEKTV